MFHAGSAIAHCLCYMNNIVFLSPVCNDCDKSYHGDCPVHGPLIPLDESWGWDQDSNSFTGVPVPLQVTVKMSSIMNAGKGVFAKNLFPEGLGLVPTREKWVQKEDVTDETDTSNFWELKLLTGWR